MGAKSIGSRPTETTVSSLKGGVDSNLHALEPACSRSRFPSHSPLSARHDWGEHHNWGVGHFLLSLVSGHASPS